MRALFNLGQVVQNDHVKLASLCGAGVVSSWLETVQDFLIKLDIKPLMHLLEISTFSLNNVIVRLTKIMNRADKKWAQF